MNCSRNPRASHVAPDSGGGAGARITVNGRNISEQAVNIESAFHPAADPRDSQYQAAVALVVRELLLQRAAALDLYQPTEAASMDDATEDAAIDALLDREVSGPEADERFCRTYFDNNRQRFRSPDLLEVRHILLAAAPDDQEGRERSRALAVTLIAELQEHPEAFAQLARDHSACPSRERNGELGWISRGQTVPELEDALLRMAPGLARQPVETRYGFHVVWMDTRLGGEPLDFEQVREQVAGYLEEQSRRRALSQYLQRLIGAAEISGIELEGAKSPLLRWHTRS